MDPDMSLNWPSYAIVNYLIVNNIFKYGVKNSQRIHKESEYNPSVQ